MNNRGNRKILLVGDVNKAFLNANGEVGSNCDICASIPEAIRAVTGADYDAITIVMHGISGRLGSTLRSLRQIFDSRIVLLAQMYEEPIAIKMVGSRYKGKALVNDYLICPVRPKTLYESVMGIAVEGPTETAVPAGSVITVDAATEMRIRQLEKLATEDDLTGLKNRRYIWEFSRQIIERSAAENGQVTLLVFDIDDFKHYNDVYGHNAGDEILKQAAGLMKRCCRAHDVVGRIGGDEFAVVFWDDPLQEGARNQGDERRSPSAAHPRQAISIAKRLVRELETTELSTSGDLGPKGKGVLTISGGLASYPRDGETIQELFEQADKALLEAKRSGKNRIYLVGKPQANVTDTKKTPPKS